MRRWLGVLVLLGACAAPVESKPLDPCCPPYAVVPVPDQPAHMPTAVQRLRAANGYAPLVSVRRIDQYQVIQIGDVGALLSGDIVVNVCRLR